MQRFILHAEIFPLQRKRVLLGELSKLLMYIESMFVNIAVVGWYCSRRGSERVLWSMIRSMAEWGQMRLRLLGEMVDHDCGALKRLSGRPYYGRT